MPLRRRLALALLLFVVPPVSALTFTVDDTGDATDASPGDTVCATAGAVCTLRAAIAEAQALGGQHLVTLPAGTITLGSPLPTITADVTVSGQGADLSTISGGGTQAILLVGTGGILHVDDVRLSDAALPTSGGFGAAIGYVTGAIGADVTVTSAQIRMNAGPALALDSGTLTVVGSALVDNVAGAGRDGGAIWVGGADLEVTDVVLMGNHAGATGGAIAIEGAPSTATHQITNAIFTSNTATNGGAVSYAAAAGAQTTFTGCSFSANSATGANGGGAMWLNASGTQPTVTIADATFLGNFATVGDGGGVLVTGALAVFSGSTFEGNQAAGGGGGICGFGFRVVNTTVSGNQAARGGGIWFNSGTNTLANVTIVGNTATGPSGGGGFLGSAHPSVRSTIVAGNTASPGPDCAGGMTSAGYNLVGNGTGCTFTSATGDQVGSGATPIDPLVGALADNGGPTKTRALQPGSPAIDAGNPAGCTDLLDMPLLADQRGDVRPTDGDGSGGARCDVGAYEAPAVTTTTTTIGPGSSTTTTATATTTTLPAVEVCGNCVDDDGDGEVDFADPDCCAPAPATALGGRLAPAGAATRVRLALALPDPGVVAADPVTQDVVVELHGDGLDYCARIPAGRFRSRKGKTYRFADRRGTVASGLRTVVLERTAAGLQARIAGRAAAHAPSAGPIEVVLAFDRSRGARCATITKPFVAKGKKGVLVVR